MRTLPACRFGVACLIGLLLASGVVLAESRLDAAVAETESRVVQLRYFGDAGGGLGSAAPTVTGYDLGNGWVLTSLYALEEDPAAILCRTPAGEPVEARVAARDHHRGLALLRLNDRPNNEPHIQGRPARVGETAIALGRVYAEDRVNVTVGIVSATGRLGGRAVQTDAAVSPTNYGGPLLGLDGVLLGVITPLTPPGQDGLGLYDSGIGFAVPADAIADRLERLAAGRDIHSGWLGVTLVNDDPLRSPARVAEVRPESPAARAGLQEGDTIGSLAGQPTPTVWAVRRVLGGLDAGQTVSIEVHRGDQELAPIEAKLEEPPSSLAKEDPANVFTPAPNKQSQPDQP